MCADECKAEMKEGMIFIISFLCDCILIVFHTISTKKYVSSSHHFTCNTYLKNLQFADAFLKEILLMIRHPDKHLGKCIICKLN